MTIQEMKEFLKEKPRKAFAVIVIDVDEKYNIEVPRAELFGKDIAAPYAIVERLKEICSDFEEDLDKILTEELLKNKEDNK